MTDETRETLELMRVNAEKRVEFYRHLTLTEDAVEQETRGSPPCATC